MENNEIEILEKQYAELVKTSCDLSNKITEHLHKVFDDKLAHYNTWEAFLMDINTYASVDTFGKLIYINHAKNNFNKVNNS
ncbi:hypothetical protein [Chryseobacterium sp. HR92]|uniref:hypothetical protein n=1 Tax=Chryseobacterium sp. HR92 TaxID=3094839 RepID=UPI00388F8EDD|nr:hypothetical protein SFA27_16850 [Chryseobacterium sp. HR92]